MTAAPVEPTRHGINLSLVAVLTLVITVTVVTPAVAAKTDLGSPAEQHLLDEAIGGRCVPGVAKDVLRAFQRQIATAPTLDEARALVLAQTGLARTALSTAAWILPFSPSVRDAREKILNLEDRVYAAASPVEVANEFGDLLGVSGEPDRSIRSGATGDDPMMLAGADLNKPVVDIGGGGGCHYTTGEIIIIVLGFLLFIIPGIIFLIIFC